MSLRCSDSGTLAFGGILSMNLPSCAQSSGWRTACQRLFRCSPAVSRCRLACRAFGHWAWARSSTSSPCRSRWSRVRRTAHSSIIARCRCPGRHDLAGEHTQIGIGIGSDGSTAPSSRHSWCVRNSGNPTSTAFGVGVAIRSPNRGLRTESCPARMHVELASTTAVSRLQPKPRVPGQLDRRVERIHLTSLSGRRQFGASPVGGGWPGFTGMAVKSRWSRTIHDANHQPFMKGVDVPKRQPSCRRRGSGTGAGRGGGEAQHTRHRRLLRCDGTVDDGPHDVSRWHRDRVIGSGASPGWTVDTTRALTRRVFRRHHETVKIGAAVPLSGGPPRHSLR
jgi:hypothetical protein